MRAAAIEAIHRSAGLPVEIEAGPVGFMVYGPSARTVMDSARALMRAIRQFDAAVLVDPVATEPDERPETRVFTSVRFDWSKVEQGKQAPRKTARKSE